MTFDAQILAAPPEIVQEAGRLMLSEPCLAPDVIAAAARGVPAGRRGILCAPGWRDLGLCRASNDWMREMADASGGRLGWLASVSPLRRGARAELDRCFDAGACGAGELDSASQGWTMGERGETRHVVAACSERGKFAVVRAAMPGRMGAGALEVLAFARAHPELVFASTSLGGGLFLQASDASVAEHLRCAWWLTSSSHPDVAALARGWPPTSHRVVFGSRERETTEADASDAASRMAAMAREMMMP